MSLRTFLMMFLAGVVGVGCPLRKDAVAPGDGGLDRPSTGTSDVATPADKPSDSKAAVDQTSAAGGSGSTATGGDTATGGSDGLAGAGGISGTATGGSGTLGGGPGSGGGGITGAAGSTVAVTDCLAGSTRLCKDDPILQALGNCGAGQEACVAGHWGPCSVLPAAKDGCALVGDDATCNGRPNEGCPCVDGATQPCGPAADTGICKRGTQTCAGAAWGACVGAVYAAARDCTSSADNNCDGAPDNALDTVCVCAGATMRPCSEHVGKDGTGRCKAGTQSCVVATDKKTSNWGACTGSVAPAAMDTCDPGNDDNCNGVPNEGCGCVTGATQACGPSANVGICKRGTQTCTAGAWGACVGAVQATARDCTSAADNNCDGLPDNTVDAVCGCASGATQACNQHPGKDGNGPCKAGSQTCVVAADKKSSAWGTCTGAVGPAAADTCDATNDDNCNGIPHDACTCVNGTTRACGPTATGICKPGTQTCTNATWSTTCVGAVTAQARDCTSSADNNCDGSPDNTVDAVCGCASGATQACNQHPGNDGKGPCKAGSQACVVATDKKSSAWGTCTGAVGPAAADTCDSGNDANCNGTANEGCQCINGSAPKACGSCGTQTCSNGTLGACIGKCTGTTPMCLAPSTCVQCLMDTDCPTTSRVCDTSSHTCGCPRKGKPGNLLPNAGFDTSIAGWGGGTAWSGTSTSGAFDADGCSNSGSLTAGDTSPSGQSICLRVTPNVMYHFGGWFQGESAICNVWGYNDMTCSPMGATTDTMAGTFLAQVGTSQTGWVPKSTTFTAPTNFLTINCEGASGSLVDQLFLSTTLTSF